MTDENPVHAMQSFGAFATLADIKLMGCHVPLDYMQLRRRICPRNDTHVFSRMLGMFYAPSVPFSACAVGTVRMKHTTAVTSMLQTRDLVWKRKVHPKALAAYVTCGTFSTDHLRFVPAQTQSSRSADVETTNSRKVEEGARNTHASALSVSFNLQVSAEAASSADLFPSYTAASRSLSDSLSLANDIGVFPIECVVLKPLAHASDSR